MRKDGRAYDKNEPARQPAYRKLKRDINILEDQIEFLSNKIQDLEKRTQLLEWKVKQHEWNSFGSEPDSQAP